MIKKVFVLFLGCLVSLAGFSQSSVMEYTFANGDVKAYGKNRAETYDVAMCLENPALKGMKLTGFRAYVTTAEGLENTSLWMSKTLTLDGKNNVPDIKSFEVSPVWTELGDFKIGLLEVKLDTPYILTEDPLYLGYSLTVNDVSENQWKYPLIVTENVNPNGFFLHATTSVRKWMDYSETTGLVAYIVAYIDGQMMTNALDLKSYDTIYAEENKEFQVNFSVLNQGSVPVETVSYKYSFDGETVATENTIILDSPIEPNFSLESTLNLPFMAPSGTGSHTMEVMITEINGNPNESTSNSMTCTVNVIPFWAQHRPLVEEYTGLWCQWCPRGYLAMETIDEDYGDNQVTICYHVDDLMAVTTSFPLNFSGLPAASIDRQGEIDPYFGSVEGSDFGIINNLNEAMGTLAIAGIDIDATLENNTVNVESTVSFIQDFEEANYRVGYVLVCNNLSHKYWVQVNGFAGLSGFEGTPLEVLTTWPANVTGLVFNDVAVDVTGMRGVENSLPSSIIAGEKYISQFSFNIEGNELVQNPENLVVTAFIIDMTTGKIVNSNKKYFKEAGVDQIGIDSTVVAQEFYDLSGRKISNPEKGIYILKQRLSNGSVKTLKVAK